MGDRRPERIHPIPRLQRIAESGNQRKGSHPCLAQVFLKPIGRGLREVERPKAVGELFETYVTCELLDIRSGDDESAPFTVHYAKASVCDDDAFQSCSVRGIRQMSLLGQCVACLVARTEPVVVRAQFPPVKIHKVGGTPMDEAPVPEPAKGKILSRDKI